MPNTTALTTDIILAVSGCSMIGGISAGLAGFGSSIMFQMFWKILGKSLDVKGVGDPKLAVSVLAFNAEFFCLILVINAHRAHGWKDFRSGVLIGLFPGVAGGILAGTFALTKVDPAFADRILGLFFFLLGLERCIKMLREVWDPFRRGKGRSTSIWYNEKAPWSMPTPWNISSPGPEMPKTQSYAKPNLVELWSPDDPNWMAAPDDDLPTPPQPIQQHLVLSPDRDRDTKVSMDKGMESGAIELRTLPDISPVAEAASQQVDLEVGGSLPPGDLSVSSDSKSINGSTQTSMEAVRHEVKSSSDNVDGRKIEMNGMNGVHPSTSRLIPEQPISLSPTPSQADVSPSPAAGPTLPLWTKEDPKPKKSKYLSPGWIIVWSVFASIVAGALTGLYSTPGPPIMLLFAYLQFTKEEIRMTSSAHFLMIWPVKVACLIYFEILKKENWPLYVCCAGFNLVGGFLGTALFKKVPTKKVVALLLILIFISSAALLKLEEPSPFGYTMMVLYLCACALLISWSAWIYHLQNIGILSK